MSIQTLERPTAERRTASIFEKTVALKLSIGRLGTRRKVGKSVIKGREEKALEQDGVPMAHAVVEVDADRDMVHVAKDILESDELKKISSLDSEIRKYLADLGLPSPIFKGGVSLIPLDLVRPVDRRLAMYQDERAALVEAFLAVYPTKQQEARERLGNLYSPTDYPPMDRVRAAFAVSVQYLSFGVPGTLESISADIYEREQEKARAQVAEATEEIIGVLRGAMKDLVDHMVERLSPGADGKPRTFRNSLVRNFTEFLGNFNARNITGDVQLGDLVDQARALLQNVRPDTLRDNRHVRQHVQQGMQQLQGALDGLMVTRGTRMITLDEDAA